MILLKLRQRGEVVLREKKFLSICFLAFAVLMSMSVSELSAQNAALSFDGVDDVVTIDDNAMLSGGVGKSITVEAWVKLSSTVSQVPVVSKLLDANSKDWGMLVFEGQLLVGIESDGDDWAYLAGSVPTDLWTHLAFTFDNAADVVRLYINGQQVGNDTTLTKDMPDTDAPVLIGKNYYQDFHLDGMVDEVRIWDYARTQTELQERMNEILTGTESGLIAYWSLDEGAGQDVGDGSGNNNDGVLGTSNAIEDEDPTWIASTAPLVGGINDLMATNTGSAVFLEWSASVNATEYDVYRDTSAYFDYMSLSPLTTETVTDYSDVDDDVSNDVLGDPGHNYFYGVVASDGSNSSGLSNRVGEYDYDLGTGFDFVAVSLSDPNLIDAQDLGESIDDQTSGNGATAIYRMLDGSWQLMAFKISGAWILSVTDAIVVGQAYLVSMEGSGVWTLVGGLEPDLTNSLDTGFNSLMLPFLKANAESIADAQDIGESIDAVASGNGATAIYRMLSGSWQLMAFKSSGIWLLTVTDPVVAGSSYLVNMDGTAEW